MLGSLEYKHNPMLLEHYDEKKFISNGIDNYLHNICNEIMRIQGANTNIEKLVKILIKACGEKKDIMILANKCDSHLISHINADFLKANNLKTISMGISEMTCFGNDYKYPYNFSQWLQKRNFGDGNILIGIQLEEFIPSIEEAFHYNHKNNGINILISNDNVSSFTDLFIPIFSKNPLITGDILQFVFHYISSHMAYLSNSLYYDKGAHSLKDYSGLLLQSIQSPTYMKETLAQIAYLIKRKIKTGKSLFVFGNGGSAAIGGYFSDGLKTLNKGKQKNTRNIINISSFSSIIFDSICEGTYNTVFTEIIKKLGVEQEDVLIGISSSGNSENIIHPFLEISGVQKIGILGFGDGGVIGRNNMADLTCTIADNGNYRSYQRAEDGQRISLSAILSTI